MPNENNIPERVASVSRPARPRTCCTGVSATSTSRTTSRIVIPALGGGIAVAAVAAVADSARGLPARCDLECGRRRSPVPWLTEL